MHFVNANKIWNKNFMKQNKNRPSITEINNIRAYHRELTYHRTPAVSMKHMCIQIQLHWTECLVYTLKYYWTELCKHTQALMHTDMGYFPHKVDNISHHSADRGCMNILNGIVCLSNNWWHHIFSDPQLSASSVSRDCVLEALVHFLPGPLML